MQQYVDELTEMEPGQRLRLTLDDGSTVDGRLHQFDYTPGERLRLEITTQRDSARYQAWSKSDGGSWLPIEVRRYGREAGKSPSDEAGWTTLGTVRRVGPGEDSTRPNADDEVGRKG